VKKTALLVIDVQSGLFGGMDAIYGEKDLIGTINELIEKARRSDVPIFWIQHCEAEEGSPLHPDSKGWQIHPELSKKAEDIYVRKSHPDSFQDTMLGEELSSRDIEKLTVTGLQTEYCIDTTCRRAYSLGYEVILIEDGHSTYDSEQLSAVQIIRHHNQVLGSWFVTLKNSTDVYFAA
jgi:nicotinamidase-related amidase